MTAQRPTFRVMKNGYDRFAVDDAVDKYASQVEQLQKKLELYQQQLIETTRQLDTLHARYQEMLQQDDARKQAADHIARLALREANDIIATAQQNADEIVRESIATARGILLDLAKLYEQVGNVKSDMTGEMEEMLNQLDQFKIPQMPDLRWLNEAEKKLR